MPTVAILLLLALSAVADSVAAQVADAPASAATRARAVRVRVVSLGGKAAPEGIPVELTVMLKEMAAEPVQATTDAAGVAEFTVSLPPEIARNVPCVAVVQHGNIVFPSEVAGLGASDSSEAVELTICVALPPGRLPTWSHYALASIWVLAVGLTVFRKSDHRLPD